MIKTAVALALPLAALTLTACGTSSDTTAAAPVSASTTAAATGSTPAALRESTCRGLLATVAQYRTSGGDSAVTKAVEEAIAALPATPEWTSLNDTERQATIDGVRDAATGSCD
ncbi:hypothetical protein H0264_05835 [Nocardia huaxiensis]|uniref:DUF732 domain-containing protein n=1 Tax=Nocardia huaxiensis TaxID=2755382 RepID=A0A7D6ZYQ6_9NOCA|nr:hypothetical protein [Nocardia huaxiensis]QLY31829.1 hypothetical protein H0264_05835 [Nocardia huaxiensis]